MRLILILRSLLKCTKEVNTENKAVFYKTKGGCGKRDKMKSNNNFIDVECRADTSTVETRPQFKV